MKQHVLIDLVFRGGDLSMGNENRRKMKKFLLKAASVVSLVLVAVIDFNTQQRVSTMVFYIIPIALAVYSGGRFWGIGAALISAGIWLAADLRASGQYINYFVPYWNAVARMAFFMLAVFVIEIRSSLDREKEKARMDQLTGVANRTHFYELLSKEMDRCRRYKSPFTVVFLDCDEFKALNDQFGHYKGDMALRLMAKTMRQTIRVTDTVARFGGDEFMILMVEADRVAAKKFLERLRVSMLAKMKTGGFPLTFSFGAATFFEAPATVEEVVKKADQLMYAAKNGGKNSIVYDNAV